MIKKTIKKNTKQFYNSYPDIDKNTAICTYCGELCIGHGGFTLDHYRRDLDKDNINSPKNLIPCCSECNSLKAHWSPSQFKTIINFLHSNNKKIVLEKYDKKRINNIRITLKYFFK